MTNSLPTQPPANIREVSKRSHLRPPSGHVHRAFPFDLIASEHLTCQGLHYPVLIAFCRQQSDNIGLQLLPISSTLGVLFPGGFQRLGVRPVNKDVINYLFVYRVSTKETAFLLPVQHLPKVSDHRFS